MSTVDQHLKAVNAAADVISAGAIVGTFLGYLPPLAALAAIVWYAIQVWESKTVQAWVRLHKHKKIRRRRHRKHLEKHNDPASPPVCD